ncbi:STAS domain-containing protein [Nitrogeniibacter mangrovi]|uniref:Anti-sigma factor antagonist n=1 Tax=Nitrogeniibacter mangrovi TaxID=2016596 RepID=A0A6C1B3N2_9RHOO|nr:STAS domain-containing protein [Nitrogeniibacter mangrovi]QID18271.1 STAS domain-containing protein [Nitrogeniibacter mangrovi]
MDVTVTKGQEGTVLKLGGRFDFNAHREFRDGVDSVLQKEGRVDVDLAEVAYLDSSALGMLLMLRDKAKSAGREVRLVNARGSVRQVLEIANFSKLFAIA